MRIKHSRTEGRPPAETGNLPVNPWTGEVQDTCSVCAKPRADCARTPACLATNGPGVAAPTHVQFSQKLTEVPVGVHLPSPDEIREELLGYADVLLGRVAPPVDSPYLQLAEIATAYYARACELDMLIHEEERAGRVIRGTDYYRLRTGALRSFIDLSKKVAELGSRRLTQEQLLHQQRLDVGES